MTVRGGSSNKQNGGSRSLELLTVTLFVGLQLAGAPASAQVTFAGSQIPLAAGAWSRPTGIAVDAAGDVFVADAGSGSIVELPVIAGGFAAPLTLASGFSSPSALTFDALGNLYVADSGNGRIAELPAEKNGFGAPTTVVGGLGSPDGLAFDAAGNLFFADTQRSAVMKASFAAGGYGAPIAIGSGFNAPIGVAFDGSGNLYVADAGNHRVARIAFNSGAYGSPTTLIGPITSSAIWADKTGDLFLADASTQRVVEYPWLAALSRYTAPIPIGSLLSEPTGVVADSKGDTFVADSRTGSVWEVVTRLIPFGATSVGAVSSAITYNFTVAGGASLGQASVVMQGAKGSDFVNAGGDSCSGYSFAVTSSCGITVVFQPSGSGARSGAVEILDAAGNSVATTFLYGAGIGPHPMYIPATMTILATGLNSPGGVAVDGNGNVFISDTGSNRVVELPRDGQAYGQMAQLPVTGLNIPEGLAIDGSGNLYVASNGNDLVIRLPWLGDRYGAQSRVGTGIYGPSSIAVDTQGNVYVAETLAQKILRLQWSSNKFLAETFLGNYVREPVGIAVGGNGNVIFSCPYLNCVAEVPWTGSQYGGQSYLQKLATSFPAQMVTDGGNNLFILDTIRNQVVMVPWLGSAFGSQITVASGFNAPQGLAIDSNGALYVADTGNNRVVKIDLSLPGILTFPATYVGNTSAGGAQSALVENTGNEPLDLDRVAFPPDFPETSASTCAPGSSLASESGCTMTVNFAPLTAGAPLTELLRVSTSDGTAIAEQSFAVSGVALPKIAQSIQFPAIPAVVYGAPPAALNAIASSGLAVQYQVLSGPGVVLRSGNACSLRFSGAGTIVIEAVQPGNTQYQAAEPAIISVDVRPATVTVTPANATVTYGSLPSSFSYTLKGIVNGENPINVISGQPVLATTAVAGSAAGAYPITATQGTLSAANYVFAFAAGILTVNTATLQVNAVSVSHIYGSAMPTLRWTISGFVHGDTASVVSGAPTLSATANAGSPVGAYPILISAGTLAADNYSFSLHGATLTVTQAQLIVTAVSASVVYGQPIPQLTYLISGFVNGDLANVVYGSPGLSASATSISSAGNYGIACSVGTLSAVNYTFHCVNGTLTLQKAALLLTPDAQTMAYGGSVPALSYTCSGFVNGDTAASAVTGTPSLTSAATSHSKPGSYAITSSAGSLSAKNYSFSFGAGTMTVTKAILSVSAQNVSVTYGASLPGLVPAYSGFVNGDTVSSALAGAPSLSTSASSESAAGTYPITVSPGTLASSLYSFNFANGAVTVKQATLAVKASPVAIVYGNPLPPLTYTLSGFVNGDTAAAVAGSPVLSCGGAGKPAAGVYPITVAAGSLSSANYTFSLVNGTATVSKAPLTITPVRQSVIYGAGPDPLGYTASGLVNGDTAASALTGQPQLTTAATASSPAGTYSVAASAGTLSSANYSLQFSAGSILVNKAPLTVAANSISAAQGSTLPALSYSATGFVNGDALATATTGIPVLSTTANMAAAGPYPIVIKQGTMNSANYQLSFMNGVLTVTPPAGTAIAKPAPQPPKTRNTGSAGRLVP